MADFMRLQLVYSIKTYTAYFENIKFVKMTSLYRGIRECRIF